MVLFVIGRTNIRRKADLGQRCTANESYIGDRRDFVGKHNESKKTWEIICGVPMTNDNVQVPHVDGSSIEGLERVEVPPLA